MRGDPSRCAKCLHYCRASATFLFSHIGLCGLVVGYTIMGAFTFEALEANNERLKREEMILQRVNVVNTLWDITSGSAVLREANWTKLVTSTLSQFEKDLVKAVRKEGYDGNDYSQLQWSFSGALLYSIIVITTIGYGNIAPKTMYGKVVTIMYAIVGIPLMLLCLSNIGDAMAHSFKFIYWKVCCYLCAKPKKRQKTRSFKQRYRSPEQYEKNESSAGNYLGPSLNMSAGSTSYANNPPTRGQQQQGPPSFPSSNPHSRQDRFSDHADANRVPIISNKYILQPTDDMLPPPPDISHGSSTLGRHSTPMMYRPPPGPATLPRARSGNYQPTKNQCSWKDEPADIEFEMDDSNSEDSDEEVDVSVPIWLCLAIVMGYICGGAMLFMIWENWNFLDSSYFCFVTLTTIGFGDLVPGTAVLSEDAQLTLGLCALYLLFGMALLAMSFNLVQEEVTKLVKCIGKRLGILSEDDEDN